MQQIGAVVEIAPNHSGEFPLDLIAAAYRACRSAAVMLVVRPALCKGVDRVLDPIVRGEGVNVQGLVYADPNDRGTLLQAARGATVVVACTAELQATLSAHGINWCAADSAVSRLAVLAGPAARMPERRSWMERRPTLAGPTA